MAALHLDLLFRPRKKSDLPGPASSHIYLKAWSEDKVDGFDGKVMLLSPQALTFSELKKYIDWLREDLDRIEKLAKKKYAEDDRKQT